MKRLARWLLRIIVVLVVVAILLAVPVARNEWACQGTPVADSYQSLLPPGTHRAEARTLLTYPEWHIVHAYDDYARVISTEDPHDFDYLKAIGGYWSSLCALTEASAAHGGMDTPTKQLVYVIGTSFTLELLAKAAYEETLGRLATLIRGDARAPLDEVSAQQAADYARFLQQTPWYLWDFSAAQNALAAASTGSFRDRERRLALGIENAAKSAYAGVIASAVAATGNDDLTLHMIAKGLDPDAYDGVTLVAERSQGRVLATPRYRALTLILDDMAQDGATFVEIAGNDDILLTATSPDPTAPGALHSFPRQGYGDYRHLIMVKVPDLAQRLRDLPGAGLTLEHIHDY
ncbi:hypothetical protein [Maritimibacter dapengensis]|uniref:Lipoprotein n=1 Tax=Maritimibacter dapengensis TaxID=2836868 RepID=A0ABS6SYW7_9RHOB|nr:hypothetical protein [Maritimibacter dapengensis]MBV7377551.1 hypothetical protein [Maritimibacter dapengensis]